VILVQHINFFSTTSMKLQTAILSNPNSTQKKDKAQVSTRDFPQFDGDRPHYFDMYETASLDFNFVLLFMTQFASLIDELAAYDLLENDCMDINLIQAGAIVCLQGLLVIDEEIGLAAPVA
ncbi:hypothetical protein ACJX0J_006050, partial [Zea mays]